MATNEWSSTVEDRLSLIIDDCKEKIKILKSASSFNRTRHQTTTALLIIIPLISALFTLLPVSENLRKYVIRTLSLLAVVMAVTSKLMQYDRLAQMHQRSCDNFQKLINVIENQLLLKREDRHDAQQFLEHCNENYDALCSRLVPVPLSWSHQ